MRTIDLFCGMGGFSMGATLAGAKVIQGVDSDAQAVQAFRANHPHALGCVAAVEAYRIPGVGAVDLLLASPPCQDHSRARGKAPVDTRRQSLPWAVATWIRQCRPSAFILENVPEFERWPDWGQWCRSLTSDKDGYNLYSNVLNATDFGVPQNRRRLFVTGVKRDRDAMPPEPGFTVLNAPHTPAWTVLDPQATYPTRPLATKSTRTQERVLHGFQQSGKPDTLLYSYYSGGRHCRTLEEPLPTITTRDRFALVSGLQSKEPQIRMLQPAELARGMGWTQEPRWPSGLTRAARVKLLGNSVCPPVAQAVVERVTSSLVSTRWQ